MAFESLSISASDYINSEHPILRYLGVLHSKTGKNKVKVMQSDKHSLVAFLAKFWHVAEKKQNTL